MGVAGVRVATGGFAAITRLRRKAVHSSGRILRNDEAVCAAGGSLVGLWRFASCVLRGAVEPAGGQGHVDEGVLGIVWL